MMMLNPPAAPRAHIHMQMHNNATLAHEQAQDRRHP